MKNFFTWFMAFPSIVCIILLGCYRFQLAGQAEWITLITAWISSTATIMLGVIVFYQTENHKKRQEEDNALYQEQAEKNRQQDLMIKTAPYLAFGEIEYAQSAKNHTVAITELSPDCVRYVSNEERNEPDETDFICKYNHGQLFRFIFHCPAEKGLNNIVFREVSVYPQYPDDEKGRVDKQYRFLNKKGKTDYVNLSFLGNNRYQVCKYFMFPNDKDSYFCSLTQQFENDLLNEGKKIFFNINYIATNIYGVKISGELKFFTTALLSPEKDRIIFTEPTNLSNWLDNPEMIKKEKTNELNA